MGAKFAEEGSAGSKSRRPSSEEASMPRSGKDDRSTRRASCRAKAEDSGVNPCRMGARATRTSNALVPASASAAAGVAPVRTAWNKRIPGGGQVCPWDLHRGRRSKITEGIERIPEVGRAGRS